MTGKPQPAVGTVCFKGEDVLLISTARDALRIAHAIRKLYRELFKDLERSLPESVPESAEDPAISTY